MKRTPPTTLFPMRLRGPCSVACFRSEAQGAVLCGLFPVDNSEDGVKNEAV